MGFGPKEEKTQLYWLKGSRGACAGSASQQSDTRGKGVRSGVAGLDPVPGIKPASLALGLLLTPEHTSKAKKPARGLLWALDSAPLPAWPGQLRRLPHGTLASARHLLLDWLPWPHQRHHHCSSHPIFGEHLLCASRMLLRSYLCLGCRSTSPPQV